MPRDTTPLLAAAGSLPGSNVLHDHPAFLRASHSPWECIPQTYLVRLRALVLTFLTGSGIMAFYYKFTEFRDHPIWYLLFHFGSLSFVLSLIWHLITFAWTFTHLYYPELEGLDGGIESLIVRAMSLPSNMGSPRKQFRFTMFYSTTTVFSFMNAIAYWFVTRQHNPDATTTDGPFTDLFGVGWFKAFAMFSLYTTPALVMIIETMFFNSIKRPQALGAHFIGLVVLSGLYLGWASLGGHLTGCYPFYWLNPDHVGSKEAVAAYCIGFIGLAPLMFVLKQGFIGLREGLTNAPARMREVVRETFVDN
ncbi:hypothetical protein ISF_08699 [Cordyceps fumosorosea ARSEF 2679]|uniref:FAR-17a/AIG1-like protein n=1 Tax=Cordyceps fumosorosea (strain ARSEF 2679) TaxID=1081104 RepID=A0A162K5B0_CORFA|nr:hypothetical protein ISF_08699 [Cordyceps fumosorosea ARSEF 2679]OAA53538.1 hypothetical protein ISF_08699 [Cordyceps fumosorosea ARSEF 2679]